MATTQSSKRVSKHVRKIFAESFRVFHPELGELLNVCSQLESSVAALRTEIERLYSEEKEQRGAATAGNVE
jgi:uncharacterized small protein (DUF1192 family)